MEIAQLIERCRKGDENALDELYRTYAQRMKGVCRRYVNDEQTADDLLHDSFVVIFTSLDRLRDANRAEAWMMTITRNVALKYKDRQKTQRAVPLEDIDESRIQSADAAVRDVRGFALTEVMHLIDKLPDGYGKVFRLSVFDGLSHAEIAKLLDIEEHSSSSQLARAKQMLRKMLRRYGVLLLLLVVPAIVLWHNQDKTIVNVEKTVAEEPKGTSQPSSQAEAPTNFELQNQQKIINNGNQPKTVVSVSDSAGCQNQSLAMVVQNEPEDTVVSQYNQQKSDNHCITNMCSADEFAKIPIVGKSRQRRWSLKLAYAGSYDSQDMADRPYSFTETTAISPTGEKNAVVSFDNWTDYAIYLSNEPDVDDGLRRTRSAIVKIALNNANIPGHDKILRSSHHYAPVVWSLAAKYRFNSHWGVETGIGYTRLTSEFEMGEGGSVIRQRQTINYMGIPAKAIFNLYDGRQLSLYCGAGLVVDVPVSSRLCSDYYVVDKLESTEKTNIRANWQLSTALAAGVQFNITPNIGLFAESDLQYFIPTSGGIETYRTEHPFVLSLPVGLRISW